MPRDTYLIAPTLMSYKSPKALGDIRTVTDDHRSMDTTYKATQGGHQWLDGRQEGDVAGDPDDPSDSSRHSIQSLGSIGSILSIGSAGSVLSIGSAGSVLSIGSVGSIGSIGSVGSIGTIGSVGSIGTIGGLGRRPGAVVEAGATLLALGAVAVAALTSA